MELRWCDTGVEGRAQLELPLLMTSVHMNGLVKVQNWTQCEQSKQTEQLTCQCPMLCGARVYAAIHNVDGGRAQLS